MKDHPDCLWDAGFDRKAEERGGSRKGIDLLRILVVRGICFKEIFEDLDVTTFQCDVKCSMTFGSPLFHIAT